MSDATVDDQGVRRRRARTAMVAAGVVVALVVIGAVVAPRGGHGGRDATHKGPAADFRLPSLTDESATVSLEQFRGRPVVVNFWASWCVPCRKEMPAFQRVYERQHGRVAFVGINHEDSRSDALAFLRHAGVRYPVGYDPEGRTAPAYGLIGLPGTVLISADGQLIDRHIGEISGARLEQAITERFGSAGSEPGSAAAAP